MPLSPCLSFPSWAGLMACPVHIAAPACSCTLPCSATVGCSPAASVSTLSARMPPGLPAVLRLSPPPPRSTIIVFSLTAPASTLVTYLLLGAMPLFASPAAVALALLFSGGASGCPAVVPMFYACAQCPSCSHGWVQLPAPALRILPPSSRHCCAPEARLLHAVLGRRQRGAAFICRITVTLRFGCCETVSRQTLVPLPNFHSSAQCSAGACTPYLHLA